MATRVSDVEEPKKRVVRSRFARGDDTAPNVGKSNVDWSRFTPVFHYVGDALCWILILPLVTALRYDFNPSRSFSGGILSGVVVACVVQLLVGIAIGLYRRQWVYGTFEETLALVSSVLLTGVALELWSVLVGPTRIPRSVPAMATISASTAVIAIRSVWRLIRQNRSRPTAAAPLIVVGAGEAASQILRLLMTTPSSPYLPVALVDDDARKRGLRVQGVRVQGTVEDLQSLIQRHKARNLLIAIPSANQELLRRIAAAADSFDVEILILPPVREILGGVTLGDIRALEPEDLLGRPAVEIDSAIASQFINGRRVLVTGAGGSIGSELCQQLVQLKPAQLVMLDRDEGGLHATQLVIDGNGLLDSPNIVLADIRDEARLKEIFERFRPEVVFHAAALKHLPLLEQHPIEGWKTNVVGTYNVLAASAATGVQHFVNISTDKAANPESVLGISKRLTEQLTSAFALSTDRDWVSVRFGNVLGSRGSVLTSFHAQVKMGGPITVTHPDVTRFFMTVAEAVRLTIFAAAIGAGGEVLVLDMGQPVRILDVAKRFAGMTTPPLEIVFTGLRPGEKLHEDLLGDGEEDVRPSHPLVTQVPVVPIEFHTLTPELLVTEDKSLLR